MVFVKVVSPQRGFEIGVIVFFYQGVALPGL
jgi:hypothetical protein